MKDYATHDGLGLANLVRNKEVSASELAEEAIRRAERSQPKLNAVVFRDYDAARTAAKAPIAGPFMGVPFFLKDIFGLAKGMPTRQASGFIPPVPADHDSELTRRFRKAGLVLLGKTNVPEFGLVATTESKLYGPAHNPWKLDHSTGGSSGGSAALVAAGAVPLAHANDGGGSIRIPAAACGLVGLKPTRGRTSFAPDFGDPLDGLAGDLVVSRSVRDTAAVLDAVQGNVPGDPYWAPPPSASYLNAIERPPAALRIAIATTTLDGQPLHPDCAAAVRNAAKLLEGLGHHVAEAAPKLDQASLVPGFMAYWCAHLALGIEAIAQMTGQSPSRDRFEGMTWGLYQAGKAVSAVQYLMAKSALQMASREAAAFHQTYDVWLTPVLGRPPVPLGSFNFEETDPVKAFAPMVDYVPFTAMQNATGQPAINVPLYWNADGLPIGTQFVGRYGEEELLLRLARQLEQAQPWAQRYRAIEV